MLWSHVRLNAHKRSGVTGFTLIEMMVTVAIIAILAAIVVPSYRQYVVRSHQEKVKSIMMNQAIDIERWRARQLNYAGFIPQGVTLTADNKSYYYPLDSTATSSNRLYKITVVGFIGSGMTLTERALQDTSGSTAAVFTNWVMLAIPLQSGYDYIGLTSRGTRCQSRDTSLTTTSLFTNNICGTGSVAW